MAEKKQFFKEEVQAYTQLFTQHSVSMPNRNQGKEGVPIQVAAKLLEEHTMIDFCDQVLILLKSYGKQLPSRFVLSGVTSQGDIQRNETLVRRELQSDDLEVSLTKTNFMYLCQLTAIYQSDEVRGKPFTDLPDIKNFKRSFKRVPLADFSRAPIRQQPELTISIMQP